MIGRSNMRVVLAAAVLGAAAGRGTHIREMTAEEREAAQAKRDAARQQIIEARREEARREAFRAAAGRSAAINRWTGKPHEHNRAKARRLARVSP